jgi:hypothetical protein
MYKVVSDLVHFLCIPSPWQMSGDVLLLFEIPYNWRSWLLIYSAYLTVKELINLDFCFQLNTLFYITSSTMQGKEQGFIYKRHYQI